MSSVEESIIATQRSIITIQDELNATNDSIIALLKVDNARLEEKIVHLQHQLSYTTNKLSQVQDLLCSAEGELNYIHMCNDECSRIAKEISNL